MAKKKRQRYRDCANCTHGVYIGEGDFICDKHSHEPDKAMVIADWTPTDNYLQCMKGNK